MINDDNLFIHHVNSTTVPDRFESTLIIDGKHPFFYENDAIRQLLMAIGYHFYAVPVDYRFVLHNVHMDFRRYAKLNMPIQVVVDLQTRSRKVRGQTRLNGFALRRSIKPDLYPGA